MNYGACPDCGVGVFSISAHRGKKPCKSIMAHNEALGAGYIPVAQLASLRTEFGRPICIGAQVPSAFRRFVRRYPADRSGPGKEMLDADFLPKWVFSLILLGSWSNQSIKTVEDNPDFQVALALEYDIRRAAI